MDMKVTKSVVILETPYFRVSRDDVEIHPGVVEPYWVVHRPDAVVVCATDEKGSVILVRQTRYVAGTSTLEVPGGDIEAGEEPVSAAVRELREETGYEATRVSIVRELLYDPGRTTARVYVCRAAARLDPALHANIESPRQVVELMSEADALEAVQAGRISSLDSVVALLVGLK